MKNLVLYFWIILCAFSCGGDEVPDNGNPDDPSNLEMDVLVYDDKSGTVVVTATAENTSEYHFYMDDDETEPYISTEGYYEYTYALTGSYTIEVKAFGPSGRFLKKERTVAVIAEEPINTGEGYTTPSNYPNMELYWSDEFNGTELNDEDWCYDIGNGCPNLCGWGNNELEYYREENCEVKGGVLILEAKDEQFSGYNYTSGKVVTRGKQSFHLGRIDIRAQLPEGQGLWPALWLLGVNQQTVGWPKCGEIDIMEMVGGNGRENTVSANAFWDENGVADFSGLHTKPFGTFADKFHVFSLIWTEESLKYYVDDQLYHTLSISQEAKSELQKEMYMILNVAVGGNWPGSPNNTTSFPTSMKVDYIRAFRFI